jgi:hypothetical protein
MFNLIFSQISVTDVHSIVSTAFNMPLPKLYAVSMMWTLNARRAITAYHSNEHGMTDTTNEISGGRWRTQRRNNVHFKIYLSPHVCISEVNSVNNRTLSSARFGLSPRPRRTSM